MWHLDGTLAVAGRHLQRVVAHHPHGSELCRGTQRAIAATEILLELANYEVKMHKLQEACDVLTDIPSNHESIINARLYLRDVQDLVCAPRIRDLQERLNELHLV